MNYSTIIVIMFLAIVAFIILKILMGPIKILLKLIYSCLISAIGLFIFNILGNLIGLHIGINLITIISVGVLGIPGIALILILQTIF